MKKFGYGVGILAALCTIVALFFGLTWLGIEWRGFFGPKAADVERETFQKTRSYNQGMVQQLTRYRLQYIQAEAEDEKKAIASTVRIMFAEYDPASLPNQELRDFLKEVNR